MAVKKEQIPKWFSPHGKPDARWIYVPHKTLSPTTEISKIKISEGETLNLKPDAKYRIETDHELDWGGCYYPNDTPEIKSIVYLVEFSEKEVPNPSYKNQMKTYNEQMNQVHSWDHWKQIWDKDQARKKELSERRELAKLKKKYEKS